MKIITKFAAYCAIALFSVVVLKASPGADRFRSALSLKMPGNPAEEYNLSFQPFTNESEVGAWQAEKELPVKVTQKIENTGYKRRITIVLMARQDIYFNYRMWVETGFRHEDCQFYMPGFWYRHNLRSPREAPSFHTSDSWTVREDRLSSPLTGIFDERSGAYVTVARTDRFDKDALTTHKEGEVILSGSTSIGFTGFENKEGKAMLAFGFPYRETPKTYIRKLTLAPPVTAFQFLKQGQELTLNWEIREGKEADFSDFVSRTWEYCYDTYRPLPVETTYTPEKMKDVLSSFFTQSFVDDQPLNYYSGVHLRTDDCKSTGSAEVGFVGRVLLNAFNAWEYGEAQDRTDLKRDAQKVFDSYQKNGFSSTGFFREFVDFQAGSEETTYSIRRQSEGTYAILHYLFYEREQKRKHPEWEQRIKTLLDLSLKIQNADGSFPRKFKDDLSVVDKSGGSTPSATLPLILGYKYFKDKRYLEAAKRTADYLEKELISKADYFSSTLDANCEDKEASLYAATATYYLALISKGKEREHYAALTRKAAYFALSWYYLWDVPFAQGQMLGDIGLKTRGWGNVSVENNHIDVFVFEFASVLNWLAREYGERRFSDFAEVIYTSMRQLLPYEGHLCGVAKRGYYPEVVQHTNWDYGKNGKGFYNDIFAPGWTVASLWELLSPQRTEKLLK
ncbi:hypothetical protein [Parabacteroides sp. Marseille-P3160]|uniref:hypothetical protein n=1 Tax=Parabacteroides sp. Marseille-P3160 TaxID=1917887 RepID=UPI0009B9FC78|nr:hypothetical protein [Parabacteroides sp. Marseille-P3160]